MDQIDHILELQKERRKAGFGWDMTWFNYFDALLEREYATLPLPQVRILEANFPIEVQSRIPSETELREAEAKEAADLEAMEREFEAQEAEARALQAREDYLNDAGHTCHVRAGHCLDCGTAWH